jgi:hypothetical protein
LFSHLFFARLFTRANQFDNYLPKGMNWGETLNECWILLKNELSKKEIDTIDIFINLTFKDLFNKLQDKECIDNIDDLIDFENDLEQLINEKIDLVKKENEKYKKFIKDIKKDKNSSFYLLTEAYESQDSIGNDYPFFEYFYYCDYLDEKYINEKLSHMDENKYTILIKYLEYKKNNSNKNDDCYSLDNLYLFNTVLNLFSEKYSHQITREYAEKKLLKDDEIYQNEDNKKLIDAFMKYYNKLKISRVSKNNKDSKEQNIITLKDSNTLSDFFLDDSKEIGKTYKVIYKIFIEKQNKELEKLLTKKIFGGVFDSN